MRTKEETLDHFRYKAPTDETRPRFETVTDLFINAADTLWDLTPDGPGKTLAFRKLSEARMAFNSAIANGGQ